MLAAFCKLLMYGALRIRAAADIFQHYVRVGPVFLMLQKGGVRQGVILSVLFASSSSIDVFRFSSTTITAILLKRRWRNVERIIVFCALEQWPRR